MVNILGNAIAEKFVGKKFSAKGFFVIGLFQKKSKQGGGGVGGLRTWNFWGS